MGPGAVGQECLAESTTISNHRNRNCLTGMTENYPRCQEGRMQKVKDGGPDLSQRLCSHQEGPLMESKK